jgi:hypothetical protein
MILGLATLLATGLYMYDPETTEDNTRVAFNMWKHQSGRKYSGAEDEYRYNVFKVC